MNIETWPIDRIKPYDRNPRDIPERAIEALAEAIKTYGWRVPVIVDRDGVLIAGHTRLLAARRLGLTEVPVHVAEELTPEQAKAFRVADNKLHELTAWNLDQLAVELGDLKAMDIDLEALGFTVDELSKLLDGGVKDGLTDPDDIPAPPDEASTKTGDIWILGDHRLMCGDSGSVEDLDRLLDGAPIHLVNTDPPYNVKVEPRSNNAIAAGLSSFPTTESARKNGGLKHHQGFDLARGHTKGKRTHEKLRPKDRPLANDFVTDEAFDGMLLAWFGNIARVLLPGRGFYIWGGYANLDNYPPVLKVNGLYFSQGIVWDKQWPVLTRKDFMGAFEIAFYGWREGAAHVFLGPNNVTDLWHVKKITPQQMEHLTAKPAELAVRAMQYSSRFGENVLDLFGGSGSTLIAAEQTGRRAFLMELDPLYCDVICDRFQRFTGKPAVLQRTGASPIPMKPREENMR
ncbi:MAG: DNA modification methylase [Phycisphaerae bacterium]|nr:DNA modification methylase [Phycisphaerae bacterium]NUQ10600.1 ParB N-terminal domain-containing protein [Phycisphaerae bacterium]